MRSRLKLGGLFRLVLALLLFSLVIPDQPAEAQRTGNFFLPAPRTMRQHLNRAKTAIQQERYGDAVLELGALLTQDLTASANIEPQDYFLVDSSANGAQASLKSEAQRLLGTLPAKGRELYELQFGADARALLEAAIRTSDFEKLNEVVRKYSHTRAGNEAMVLLGRLHMDRGQPLAAALCFQRVLQSPSAAARYDPELSVLLAACWMYADRAEKSTETLEDLRRRFPRAQFQIGDRKLVELPLAPEALSWLKTHFGSGAGPATSKATQWLLHRGNAARNAQSDGGLPLANFRWRARTATDPTDEQLIREIQAGYRGQNIPALPSVQPLAVGNVILMRTAERLMAINFETGKRIWEYPWWDSSYPTVTTGHRSGSRSQEMEIRKQQLIQRLWRDAPYGQIASDGEAVYLLDDLRFAQADGNDRRWFPLAGGVRRNNPNWPQPHNQLVSLDLHRQGSLKWIVGGETGMNEPRLARAFFLGPPLPLMGQLYVLAELNGEIRLLVLDPETGRQEWSQQLAHVDTYTILRNAQRRLSGATPSFADGVLVCPTSAGAVVAVDLATRALLWGYQYEPVVMEMHRFNMANPFPTQTPDGSGWVDATVTLADGKVLLTPLESNKLFCLDLLTGQPLWPPRLRQGELTDCLFVAGVHEGHAILVGKHRLVALRLQDGKPAWPTQIYLDESRGEMPSGRGILRGRYYYLPTTTEQLLKIDLSLGKIVEHADTGQVLGNLIAYRGELVSQNTDYLSTFYQIEPLRALVKERLATNPDDAWALARRGELLIYEGDLVPALQALRRAYQLDPADEAVRAMLVDTLLRALRDDFRQHQPLAVELEQLIERPAQQHEYLRLMASGLHQANQLDAALDAYLKLTYLVLNDELRTDSSGWADVKIDEQSTARLDRWLHARLSSLFAEGTPELRGKLDDAVQSVWTAHAEASGARQQQFLALFGFHPQSRAARKQLAQQHVADERWLDAQHVVAELANQAPAEAVALVDQLGAQLNKQSKYLIAGGFYEMLRRRWPDVVAPSGQTGTELWNTATLESAGRQPSHTFPYGRVIASSASGPSDNSYRRISPVPVRSAVGRGNEQLTVAFDGSGSSAILVRSGQGELLMRVPLEDSRGYFPYRNGVNYAHIHGNLLIVVLADQVIAVDMMLAKRREADAIRWRDSLSQGVPNLTAQSDGLVTWSRTNPLDPDRGNAVFVKDSSGQPVGSVGLVNSRGAFVLKSRTLLCLDPLNGETCWTRRNVTRGSDLFGDEEHLFIASRGDQVASVLSTEDGSPLGTCAIPDWDHRWNNFGAHVLAWEDSESIRLYLYDAWQEKEVWSEQLPRGARGTLVGDRHVALMWPDGRFRLRSLASDVLVIDQQLEPEPELAKIHVIPSEQQFLLATSRPLSEADNGVSITAVGGGMPAPLIDGRIYLFDRSDGRSLWQTPAYIDRYGLPLYQPVDLPSLWLLRQRSTRVTRRAPSQSDRTSVLCLDKRTGRIIAAVEEVRTRTTSYDIVPNFPDQSVRLRLPGHSIDVKFTDEVVPPEPPAQTGAASSLKEVIDVGSGSILGALQRILKSRLPHFSQP